MRHYESKILKKKIVDDPDHLTALAIKFGYRVGDLVKPVDWKKRNGLLALRERSVRCSWHCNRERPISRGRGRHLDPEEGVVVIDLIDSSNGRLTVVMTSEGKTGYVLSSELELVQRNPERE